MPNLIPESTPSTTTRLADALNVDAVALAVIPNPGYPLKGFDTVRAALTRANEQMSDRAIGLVVTTDKPLGLVDEHIYTTPELLSEAQSDSPATSRRDGGAVLSRRRRHNRRGSRTR